MYKFSYALYVANQNHSNSVTDSSGTSMGLESPGMSHIYSKISYYQSGTQFREIKFRACFFFFLIPNTPAG